MAETVGSLNKIVDLNRSNVDPFPDDWEVGVYVEKEEMIKLMKGFDDNPNYRGVLIENYKITIRKPTKGKMTDNHLYTPPCNRCGSEIKSRPGKMDFSDCKCRFHGRTMRCPRCKRNYDSYYDQDAKFCAECGTKRERDGQL